MGGVVVSLRVEPFGDAVELPRQVAKDVWYAVSDFLWVFVPYPGPESAVLSKYLSITAPDHLAADGDGAHFVLRDWAGCRVAALASEHWLEMVFATHGPWDAILESAGFLRRPPERPLWQQWLAPRTQLATFRGQLVAIGRQGEVWGDDGPIRGAADLDEVERRQVAEAVAGPCCRCVVCGYLRDTRDADAARWRSERAGT